MNEAKAVLADLEGAIAQLPRRRVLPAERDRPTFRMLAKLGARDAEAESKPPKDRIAEVRRLVLNAQANGTWDSLTARDRRDACWLLWPDANDGVDRQRLLNLLLQHIEGARK